MVSFRLAATCRSVDGIKARCELLGSQAAFACNRQTTLIWSQPALAESEAIDPMLHNIYFSAWDSMSDDSVT
jgi:hypothetical protein